MTGTAMTNVHSKKQAMCYCLDNKIQQAIGYFAKLHTQQNDSLVIQHCDTTHRCQQRCRSWSRKHNQRFTGRVSTHHNLWNWMQWSGTFHACCTIVQKVAVATVHWLQHTHSHNSEMCTTEIILWKKAEKM